MTPFAMAKTNHENGSGGKNKPTHIDCFQCFHVKGNL